MRIQLQLELDHRPSFKAGAELVCLPSPLCCHPEVYLQCNSVDGFRSIPVVIRAYRPGVLKRFPVKAGTAEMRTRAAQAIQASPFKHAW
jgi:hypothetical protein